MLYLKHCGLLLFNKQTSLKKPHDFLITWENAYNKIISIGILIVLYLLVIHIYIYIYIGMYKLCVYKTHIILSFKNISLLGLPWWGSG